MTDAKARTFWLVRGKHASANWHVFETLARAEQFVENHYKQYRENGFEIIRVTEGK